MALMSILALAAAGGAVGGAGPAKGADGTQVSGVVVTAGPPPKVVSTFPADGARAPGGVIVLKIVFDQPMTADAWSFGRTAAGAFPNCLAHPRLLGDGKTFALLCTVAPNQSYAVQINPSPVFANAGGRSARPCLLRFATTETATRNMHDALEQAGLTDADEPIMTWNDAGGVSRSPPPDDGATP